MEKIYRYRGSLIGPVVVDALGTTTEFIRPGIFDHTFLNRDSGTTGWAAGSACPSRSSHAIRDVNSCRASLRFSKGAVLDCGNWITQRR